MFHAPGFGHGSRNVNDGGKRINPCRSANLFHIVHAVLHAKDERAGSKQRSQRVRRRCVVRGLHAKQNNFRAANGAEFGGGFDSYTFLKPHCIEEESVLLDGFDKRRTSDHHHRRTRARQQSAEISPHGARTNNGNLWPVLLRGHGVTTLISRSMSRSVLYKYGETRMLPSRKLTTTFSFRRRW